MTDQQEQIDALTNVVNELALLLEELAETLALHAPSDDLRTLAHRTSYVRRKYLETVTTVKT